MTGDGNTTGLAPGPISQAFHTGRTTEAEAQRQIRQVLRNF